MLSLLRNYYFCSAFCSTFVVQHVKADLLAEARHINLFLHPIGDCNNLPNMNMIIFWLVAPLLETRIWGALGRRTPVPLGERTRFSSAHIRPTCILGLYMHFLAVIGVKSRFSVYPGTAIINSFLWTTCVCVIQPIHFLGRLPESSRPSEVQQAIRRRADRV